MGATFRQSLKEAKEKGLDGKQSYLYAANAPERKRREEEQAYLKQEQEFKKQQEEFKKQQAQQEADQKRRAEESANQARLSAQLAADSGTSDTSVIQTGGDLLGDTPESGKRRRRRQGSGASAVGI